MPQSIIYFPLISKKKAIGVAKDMLKGKRKKPLLVSKNKIKRDIKRKTKAIAASEDSLKNLIKLYGNIGIIIPDNPDSSLPPLPEGNGSSLPSLPGVDPVPPATDNVPIDPATGLHWDADATMLLRRLKVYRFTQRMPKPAKKIPFCARCFAQYVQCQAACFSGHARQGA